MDLTSTGSVKSSQILGHSNSSHNTWISHLSLSSSQTLHRFGFGQFHFLLQICVSTIFDMFFVFLIIEAESFFFSSPSLLLISSTWRVNFKIYIIVQKCFGRNDSFLILVKYCWRSPRRESRVLRNWHLNSFKIRIRFVIFLLVFSRTKDLRSPTKSVGIFPQSHHADQAWRKAICSDYDTG